MLSPARAYSLTVVDDELARLAGMRSHPAWRHRRGELARRIDFLLDQRSQITRKMITDGQQVRPAGT